MTVPLMVTEREAARFERELKETDMGVPKQFTDREAEFREKQKLWIIAKDNVYKMVERQGKNNRPLRHPKGETFDATTREYKWADAIGCQDAYDELFLEMFELPYDYFWERTDRQETFEWMLKIFTECFREVLPKELWHIMEG